MIEEGIKPFFRTLQGQSEAHIAPKGVSSASLADYLFEEGKRIIPVIPGPSLEYNSGYIMADELANFMPEWSTNLAGALTSYWDGVEYSEWKRTAQLRLKMERVCVNMLAGMTPAHMQSPKVGGLIPEGMWDQGLMSRVILIYGAKRQLTNLFKFEPDQGLPQDLVEDFHYINGLHAELGWDDDFANAFTAWRESHETKSNGPDHPKLTHYNVRRGPMLFKLAIIACVDRGMGITMNLQDWERAYGWLKDAESVMSEAFKVQAGGPDSKAQDELVYYVIAQYKKTQKAVPEHMLVQVACNLVRPFEVEKTIELLIMSGRLREAPIDPKTARRRFVPGV